MKQILNKSIVLVLNRNGQAINVRSPEDAFWQMATNAATGLDIEGEEYVRPVTGEEWITLPVREEDLFVRTSNQLIRMPIPPALSVCNGNTTTYENSHRQGLDVRLRLQPCQGIRDTAIHRRFHLLRLSRLDPQSDQRWNPLLQTHPSGRSKPGRPPMPRVTWI
jgi:hypothetical protein